VQADIQAIRATRWRQHTGPTVRQDGAWQLQLFRGGKRAEHEAVDHQRIALFVINSVSYVGRLFRAGPHRARNSGHAPFGRFIAPQADGALQKPEGKAELSESESLRLVAGEGHLMASVSQLLREADLRWLIAAAVPRKEQEFRHS